MFLGNLKVVLRIEKNVSSRERLFYIKRFIERKIKNPLAASFVLFYLFTLKTLYKRREKWSHRQRQFFHLWAFTEKRATNNNKKHSLVPTFEPRCCTHPDTMHFGGFKRTRPPFSLPNRGHCIKGIQCRHIFAKRLVQTILRMSCDRKLCLQFFYLCRKALHHCLFTHSWLWLIWIGKNKISLCLKQSTVFIFK